MASESELGQDRQKLAILLCFLLKSYYSSTLLQQHPFLWQKKSKNDEVIQEIGLGLKEVIKRFGFGWMTERFFDWDTNNFAQGVADNFPFPVQRLQKLYKKRSHERKRMITILQEMDQITGRINTLTESEEDRQNYRFLRCWLATRIIKQYHQDVWDGLYQWPYEFKGKEVERKRQEEESAREREEVVEGEQDPGFNKRRRLNKAKHYKGIRKSWEEPPLL